MHYAVEAFLPAQGRLNIEHFPCSLDVLLFMHDGA